jgi:hypothetical protein
MEYNIKMVDAITAKIKVFVKRLYKVNFTRFLSKEKKMKNEIYTGEMKCHPMYAIISKYSIDYRRNRSVRVVCTKLEKIHQHISESTRAKGILASSKYLDGSVL